MYKNIELRIKIYVITYKKEIIHMKLHYIYQLYYLL